jgi:hypothetical protein
MSWKGLADGVAVLHGVWVVAVLLGPLCAYRWPLWRGVHLVLLLVTVVLWSFYCPLTTLEHFFRYRYDPGTVIASGFLERCMASVLNLQEYRTPLAWAVRGWAALWAVTYGYWWAREMRAPAGNPSSRP